MEKDKKKRKHYYIWSYHWWTLISIFFSIVGFGLAVSFAWKQMVDPWPFIWSSFVFILGLFTLFIIPSIYDECSLKRAYDNGLLWKALAVFIDNKDYHKEEDGKRNDNKYKYYLLLKEACEVQNIRANLDLDGRPFDDFFSMEGSLSVTDANISAWKYPEYSWFLTSQYAASIYKQGVADAKASLDIEDRKDEGGRMKQRFKSYLEDLYKNEFDYKGFTRVYLLSQDDFTTNKSMIEQFVAGHTLFGIRIYIIDRDNFLAQKSCKEAYIKMIEALNQGKSFNELPDYKQYLDIMCYKRINNPDDVFYTDIDLNSIIVERNLKDRPDAPSCWNNLIVLLKQIVTSESTLTRSLVLYPTTDFCPQPGYNLNLNEHKSLLLFNK